MTRVGTLAPAMVGSPVRWKTVFEDEAVVEEAPLVVVVEASLLVAVSVEADEPPVVDASLALDADVCFVVVAFVVASVAVDRSGRLVKTVLSAAMTRAPAKASSSIDALIVKRPFPRQTLPFVVLLVVARQRDDNRKQSYFYARRE